MSDPWHENAVIYELDVKSIQDSNADGIGDFRGLISRIDYIRSLGVRCVWLQPFYVTPDLDNGYDVADYEKIDPRLGTMEDFDAFVRAAKDAGLRIIADLPLNHTSDQHHWYQAARKDRNSPYRDYYIWADKLPENPAPYPIFGPEQGGNWKWDDVAGQYYFHTFYRFMPDLNFDNPKVCEAALDVARFWMNRGIDGFRLDAVPFLHHLTEDGEEMKTDHAFFKDLHKAVTKINPEAILLAEANLKPEEMKPFFGRGDEMHLLLNFHLNNHLFLALATGQAEPIQRAWDELPKIPKRCNWANFIRNHDELSLDQLTDDERQQCFEQFGPSKDVQLYDRGIRRRLAPMLGGDQRKIRLIYSLLLSLPGTPVINAGEEIGLGDDLSLKDREAGRTPMQWSNLVNGGFSLAERQQLYRPVIVDGPYGFQTLNVQKQDEDERSLLNFMRRAIKAYNTTPEFGRGDWEFHSCGHPAVLVHHCRCDGRRAYGIHNLSDAPLTIDAPLPEGLADILADQTYTPVTGGRAEIGAYGFRWLL